MNAALGEYLDPAVARISGGNPGKGLFLALAIYQNSHICTVKLFQQKVLHCLRPLKRQLGIRLKRALTVAMSDQFQAGPAQGIRSQNTRKKFKMLSVLCNQRDGPLGEIDAIIPLRRNLNPMVG